MYRKKQDQSSVRYTLGLKVEDLCILGQFLSFQICPKCCENITKSPIENSIGFRSNMFAACWLHSPAASCLHVWVQTKSILPRRPRRFISRVPTPSYFPVYNFGRNSCSLWVVAYWPGWRAERSSNSTFACLGFWCLLFHFTCMQSYNMKDDNFASLQWLHDSAQFVCL